MKYLLIVLLFSSCAMFQAKYLPLSDRKLICIKELTQLDVEPNKASRICDETFRRK
jgi:hypothetical protein